MSWFYQPLPLASTFSVTDVDEALTGEEFETEHGTLTQSASALLSGQASASGQGSVTIVDDEEQLQGQEADVEQGSLSVNNLVVRLRSRKVGGTSTAENILQSQASAVQQGNPVKVLSVLLGGSGITSAQQSFPTRTRACLLTGQVRTTHQGTVVYQQTGGGTGAIPSWVQLPTQLDEQNFYDANFGADTGKDAAWTWTSSDKTIEFTTSPPATLATEGYGYVNAGDGPKGIHEDSEGDDLWTHYNQHKRTGSTVHLDWATAWRDYFVNVYPTDMNAGAEDGGRNFDHLYGQGLVMWGMEKNDLAARNAALTLAAMAESNTLALVPGTSQVSVGESRRFARRLIFYSYIVMMEPIARWIACRDNLLECWLQNPLWLDTTNSNIVIGGNHFAGRQNFGAGGPGPGTIPLWDLGYRHNAAWQYALHNEALWLCYKMVTDSAKKTEIKNMLVEMARYTLYYAWDPSHVNAFQGARWGHRPDGTHWHFHQDDWDADFNPIPDPVHTDPTRSPTTNYEASAVNGLVRAYKLTGETPFLKRAREHFRQATQYIGAGGNQLKQPDNVVNAFVDTQCNPNLVYFEFNKGMLQYCSEIFENGGAPTVEPSATWQAPYPVPTSPGQVVKIAGDKTSSLGHGSGGSTYATNVMSDVRPSEVGSASIGNQMAWNGDTRNKFIETFSQAGAMVIAGSGGHGGTQNYGAIAFDFEDARWKRIWTTAGNPGVDNITNEGPRPPPDGTGPPTVDIRTGTTIHGCLNKPVDPVEAYIGLSSNPHGQTEEYNPDHWNTTTGGAQGYQLARVPRTADPKDQFWEVSCTEARCYNRTPASGADLEHSWPYPGEFNGLGQRQFPGRFTDTGYIMPTHILVSGGFNPTPAGTLAPTQSELPASGHVWDQFYEVRPEEGGGPRGSIVTAWRQNIGDIGTTNVNMSHRFDLHTGIWHEFSTNKPDSQGAGLPQPPAGGPGAAYQPSGIAGAEDPVTRRGFLIAKRYGKDSGGRVNYINIAGDRTWRNFSVGTGGGTMDINTRTENMWVDPDRRLLLIAGNLAPYLWAFDLQTLGQTGAPEPTPSHGLGGFKTIPFDDLGGIQVGGTWNNNAGIHNGNSNTNCVWRYYPPNGKYYRVNPRSMADDAAPPYADITVLQRLTPPPIVATPRANFYYTTESMSGRWTLDEITLGASLPAPDEAIAYSVAGFAWFHYVPALQCFAYAPLDFAALGGRPAVRRCVYLIKPF